MSSQDAECQPLPKLLCSFVFQFDGKPVALSLNMQEFYCITLFVHSVLCQTAEGVAIYSPRHLLPFFADRHSCPLPPATKTALIILAPPAVFLLCTGMF